MTTTSGVASPVVSGTTPLPTSSSSAPRPRPRVRRRQQIAGNFQTFLTLLTTQLQNQNPLDPLDTNQFTQQLVEFAGVQQQLNTNDSLTTLVSLQQTAQSTQALGFVGKTAVVDGSTAALTNSSATWDLSVPTRFHRQRLDHQQHRANRVHRHYAVNAGNNQPSPGTARATTARNGRTASTN